jgi:cobalt/nickel transport protein
MKTNIGLLLAVLVITVVPFFMSHDIPEGQDVFSGADGQIEHVVSQIRSDYEPWFQPLWEPPGAEIESLLFGLQAAVGAGLIGYCLGFYRARKRLAGGVRK